jgi:DNA-directed RNA polymerase subunit K/omega
MANFDKVKSSTPLNTITYNKSEIEAPTGNIYKAINIVSKRSNQINIEVKKELINKLEEFATHNDSLEEVFENKEQIEVSRYFEKLPKSHAIALEEWMDGKIYYRDTNS